MAGQLSKGLRAAAFLSLAIVALAAGCDHPRSTPEGASAPSNEVSQVSQALIGKQITIRGKFSLWGKVGPYVALDNHQAVYLVPMKSESFTWGKPYSEMDGKRVAVTGVLRFYHEPDAKLRDETVQYVPDFFYFEAEIAQLRLINH